LVFDHFPFFCAQIGIGKMTGKRLEVLFRENQIFLCFCVFLRSFWHRKILRKNKGKNCKKSGKLIANFFPENGSENTMKVSDFWWFCLVRILPVFYMALKNVHAHWLSLAW
jgi:hypothetical protein